MDRSEILDMMAALQLSGMRAAYDEIVTTGIKRKHGIDHIIGALLKQELVVKRARSIRYQMGIAKLPLAKELADSSLPIRRSTSSWSAIWPAGTSWRSNATW